MESSNIGNICANNIDQNQSEINQTEVDQKKTEISISNDIDVTSKIEFDNGDFNYVVEFVNKLNGKDTITINCTHKEEFYCWSFITSDIIKTSKFISKEDSASLNINIKPKMLFKIFSAYKDNTLDKIYQIGFPKRFTSSESSITIELTTVLPMMDSYIDTKFITLNPKKIDEVERCSLKFMRLNHIIEQKNQENIQKINKEIEEIQVSQSAFSEYVREKYAKIDDPTDPLTQKRKENEFVEQLKNFLTKPEYINIIIGALKPTLDKYVTKENLEDEYVTKENLENELQEFALETDCQSIFATKIDLDKYVLKPV
ncbi:hypothetical protein QJ850_gp110 [Acanthamoeba polyphaga mimivirus]|uniref:Uncharacterized protein n=1 Tax=Acanthamoeba polyphaga mimivirus Kroon TaxID=3069720 RepID=A0A0G2Y7R0_9VIRU|nr:hypothetical protein QJ850_gp110 [Acanthamoeba polyphaga mimivirus]AKI80589.1 hypothetical protein [Acanthamoeba polyphaga mimivirus Kroon]